MKLFPVKMNSDGINRKSNWKRPRQTGRERERALLRRFERENQFFAFHFPNRVLLIVKLNPISISHQKFHLRIAKWQRHWWKIQECKSMWRKKGDDDNGSSSSERNAQNNKQNEQWKMKRHKQTLTTSLPFMCKKEERERGRAKTKASKH